jgi:hypothetical protein
VNVNLAGCPRQPTGECKTSLLILHSLGCGLCNGIGRPSSLGANSAVASELSRGGVYQRSKRFEPQLQEICQMFFRLSLCFTTAVVGQEIAMRQARVPRPQVSLKRHTTNHGIANECRSGMRAVLKPGNMRRGHYCSPLSDQRENPHH